MKKTLIVISIMVIMLSGCGKKPVEQQDDAVNDTSAVTQNAETTDEAVETEESDGAVTGTVDQEEFMGKVDALKKAEESGDDEERQKLLGEIQAILEEIENTQAE